MNKSSSKIKLTSEEEQKLKEIISKQKNEYRFILRAKIVLYAIFLLDKKNVKPITTGHLFSVYTNLCKIVGVGCLTQRRVSDIISQLDTLGLISTEIVSRGRHGRTRIIRINIDKKLLLEALKNWIRSIT